tara:strand:- start:625 stop:735 length:111 start_codon:yes stop_codon:yes gene_type:complete
MKWPETVPGILIYGALMGVTVAAIIVKLITMVGMSY